MRILIAPDKFKGTLTAQEAAEAMAEAVRRHHPAWEAQLFPLADGGEGTADLLTQACGGTTITLSAADPLFRQVRCEYGLSPDGTTAFIDLAQASGLNRLLPRERNPMRTSTVGTGELISHALNRRVKRIIVGLGGSATMDAGTGILHGLGVQFKGEDMKMLLPTGGNMGRIEYIQTEGLRFRRGQAELIFLYDTHATLLGDSGIEGVMTYGPQKGLKKEDFALLNASFGHFANLVQSKYGTTRKVPGFGAAGGAAFAPSALLPIQLVSGANWIMDQLGIDEAIHAADFVLTGEGQIDQTSLDGKCLGALLERTTRQSKPLLAITGFSQLSTSELQKAGLAGVETLSASPDTIPENPYQALRDATTHLLQTLAPRLQA